MSYVALETRDFDTFYSTQPGLNCATAQLIFIGEQHTAVAYRCKYSKLIDAIAKECKVVVLVEGAPSMESVEKATHPQTQLLKSNVTVYGWDTGTVEQRWPGLTGQKVAALMKKSMGIQQMQVAAEEAGPAEGKRLFKEVHSATQSLLKEMREVSPCTPDDDFRARTTSMNRTIKMVVEAHPDAKIIAIAGEGHLTEAYSDHSSTYSLASFYRSLSDKKAIFLKKPYTCSIL